jgi:hypothetical protein
MVPAEGICCDDATDVRREVPSGMAQEAEPGTSSCAAGEVPGGRARATGAVPREEAESRGHQAASERRATGRGMAAAGGGSGEGAEPGAAVARGADGETDAAGVRLRGAGAGWAVTEARGMSRAGLDQQVHGITRGRVGFCAWWRGVTRRPRGPAVRARAIFPLGSAHPVREAGGVSRAGLRALQRGKQPLSRAGLDPAGEAGAPFRA